MIRALPTPLTASPVPRAAPRGAVAVRASATSHPPAAPSRREALGLAAAAAAAALAPRPAAAFEDDPAKLCEEDCVAKLATAPRVKTPSGLEYQDVIVGSGPSPPTGFQVTVNYVAMTPDGRIFESSVERKAPYDIRVGSGQVIPGLDEGLRTMRVGGLRRLYIPGPLAFPKGLASAPGRPRVPPGTPVMFDVQLLLIPGLDDEE